jgi:hypothetical protein
MSPHLTPARRRWTVNEQRKLDDLMGGRKDGRRDSSIYSRLQFLYRKRQSHLPVELWLKAKGK